MRRGHFAALAPLCPRCRAAPLGLGVVELARGEDILAGTLECPAEGCRQEYPILDGIPVLVPDVAGWVANNLWHVTARDDLPPRLETLIGDAAGPGSAFDTTRYHLGSYGHDHWGAFDPAETDPQAPPGAVARCLAAGLDLLGDLPAGPALDIGCAVGRTSFELARRGGLVLGVDLNFAMLRLARRVLTDGAVSYPRRRIGVVYDRRSFPVPTEGAERLDFWCCDALALPFAPARFATVAALNVLDCVAAPPTVLAGIAAALIPGGGAVLATPYDWSGAVTPPAAWLGGHSQRGPSGGAGEPMLRALLTQGAHPNAVPGLAIAGEIDAFPWHVRLHDRSTMLYRTHVVAVRRQVDKPSCDSA